MPDQSFLFDKKYEESSVPWVSRRGNISPLCYFALVLDHYPLLCRRRPPPEIRWQCAHQESFQPPPPGGHCKQVQPALHPARPGQGCPQTIKGLLDWDMVPVGTAERILGENDW